MAVNALHEKVAVVTGASSGIGMATARALAQAGAAVVIGGRRHERLEALAHQITVDGGQALALTCDVRDEAQVQTFIQGTVDRFGRIDILVNNAGVMLRSRIENKLFAEWRQMVETNVLGLLYASAHAIPYLRETKGYIVNLSSVAGRKARERGGVYSATKWGVNAISESLRVELLSDHIRVVLIEPGTTETELVSHITDPEALRAQQESQKQMHMPLQDEDVARTILWAVTQPEHVSVHEILLRPREQVF